ncbi:MAG: hypothetical protein U0269_22965 [Polyangiales bacterium]
MAAPGQRFRSSALRHFIAGAEYARPVRARSTRRWLLFALPLLLGSIPSFCVLSVRNETGQPLVVRELYGASSGQSQTAWPSAEASFRYLARNVGLMGCVAVPSAPQGLTGWMVSDGAGRTVVIARERLDRLETMIVVRERDLARGRIE